MSAARPRPAFVALPIAVLSLLLPLLGCGSDPGYDPNESETTRAIREKVRADMERDRLERYGKRLAHVNAALATEPTAVVLAAADADTSAEGAPAAIDGEAIYTQNCASCHGARGQGDGPLSASLQPKPAKHADGGYMNALTDEYLFKVISEGGAAVGKSSMMAPWGTSMSDEEIQGVIVFMRSLADPPYSG